MAPMKNKRKEKNLEPIVESLEHIDFHSSFESNGDVHSLIIPLNGLRRRKKSKQALEHLVMDKSFEKWEEEVPKVEKSSKEFLALVDVFHVFVVQQGEATTQN
jgi:hypothetical protein